MCTAPRVTRGQQTIQSEIVRYSDQETHIVFFYILQRPKIFITTSIFITRLEAGGLSFYVYTRTFGFKRISVVKKEFSLRNLYEKNVTVLGMFTVIS